MSLLTFLTDLDDLIKYHHGDVKKLREIRNTIKHDNFITSEDKKYVQSLIDEHLNNQPLEKAVHTRKSGTKIKLQKESKTSDSNSQINFAFNFSSNKKFGILGGGGAAIAIIVIVGFMGINTNDMGDSITSTTNNPLLVTVDQTQYQSADIISITGDTTEKRGSVVLSIQNSDGIKIWNEKINLKNNGNFSTMIIAGGGGWENSGSYTLKAVQNNLIEEIKFNFIT